MRVKSLPIVAGLAVAASLLALFPLAPESDPAWWLLGGMRRAVPDPADILLLDAPVDMDLSPGGLALDLRDLAEFDARSVLVDVGVDWAAGDTTPIDTLVRLRASIDEEFGRVSDNLKNFWLGLRSGSLRAVDASAGFDALEDIVASSKERLIADAMPRSAQIPSLEAALELPPAVWFGLGLSALPDASVDAETAWLARSALEPPDATGPAAWNPPDIAGIDLLPAEIADASAGSGFSLRDESGASRPTAFPMRRFAPLASYEGRLLPHPALLLLARRMGASRVLLERGGIRLVGARVFRGGRRDVVIPLDRNGRALLGRPDVSGDWPRRVPLTFLADYRRSEARVVAAIGALEKGGLLVDGDPPTALWRRASDLGEALIAESDAPVSVSGDEVAARSGGREAELAAWRAAKASFFDAAQASLSERGRMDELLTGLLTTPGLSGGAREGILALRDKADRAFSEASEALSDWRSSRKAMMDEISGSLVVIGPEPHRSRGGFSPEKGAPPVDPSADIAAFIRAGLTDSFVSDSPPLSEFLAALIAGLSLSLLVLVLGPRHVLAAGILVGLAFFGFSAFAFVEAKLWWSPTLPLIAALVPGIAVCI